MELNRRGFFGWIAAALAGRKLATLPAQPAPEFQITKIDIAAKTATFERRTTWIIDRSVPANYIYFVNPGDWVIDPRLPAVITNVSIPGSARVP